MSGFLSGRKILFITTQFYGYEKAVIRNLKDQGADLTVLYDDPVSYTRIKFLKSVISRTMRKLINSAIVSTSCGKLPGYTSTTSSS